MPFDFLATLECSLTIEQASGIVERAFGHWTLDFGHWIQWPDEVDSGQSGLATGRG